MTISLNKIKNYLLRYSLADIEGDFENLTQREKTIVRNQETLDLLIADITKDDDSGPYEALKTVTQALSDVVGADQSGPYHHLIPDIEMALKELLQYEKGDCLLLSDLGEVLAVSGNSEFDDADHPPEGWGMIVQVLQEYAPKEEPDDELEFID